MKASNNPDHLLSSYDFEVPTENIAQTPADHRENSKLFVRKGSEFFDHNFFELESLLPEKSLIILNETKVFSCRLEALTPTGAKVEVFLLENPVAEGRSKLTALAKTLQKS